jgi:hypothetical protein
VQIYSSLLSVVNLSFPVDSSNAAVCEVCLVSVYCCGSSELLGAHYVDLDNFYFHFNKVKTIHNMESVCLLPNTFSVYSDLFVVIQSLFSTYTFQHDNIFSIFDLRVRLKIQHRVSSGQAGRQAGRHTDENYCHMHDSLLFDKHQTNSCRQADRQASILTGTSVMRVIPSYFTYIRLRGRLHSQLCDRFCVRIHVRFAKAGTFFICFCSNVYIDHCIGYQMKNSIPIWFECKSCTKSYANLFTCS